MGKAFTHELTARFYHIDRAGIVFYGRVYEYVHDAFEELLAVMAGHPEEALFGEAGWAMPLVHSEADYLSPMRMGDRLLIHCRVEKIGSRSVTFAYDIDGKDGVPRARVKLVHVFLQVEDFKPRDVPQAFVDKLAELDLLPEASE